MLLLKRAAIMVISVVALLVFAACGSSPTTTTTASTPTAAAAATTPASTGTAIIKTATMTVKGASKTVLTDAQGKTLYYFTPDTTTTTACTGACATNWPPLVFTGSGQPTASGTLPGTLTVVTTADGQQVEYNGHMLYTFAGDSAPGQTNGEGKGGKWFVATSDLTTGASTGGAIIKTATMTVKGASKTVLTDAQGKTLYYFTPDTKTATACTGACATNWPPLVFTGSGQPTASGTLPGTLTVVTTANGQQVEYNGHMLYTFAGDAAPGDTKGEGLGGKWFVATSDVTPM